jgi:ferrous iron transport protein A
MVELLTMDAPPRPVAAPRPPVGQRAPAAPRKPVSEPLAGQPVGRKLKIVGFTLPPDIYQRLLEMGLTKGTPCTVVRYAPMGDPIELKVRGYSLSLRLAEAAGVQVSCP